MGDPLETHEITANGKKFVLLYNNRALRMIEKELSRPAFELFTSGERLGVSQLTVLLWAGLLAHHPDATLETADAIFDGAGYETVMEILPQAIGAARPFVRRSGTEQ